MKLFQIVFVVCSIVCNLWAQKYNDSNPIVAEFGNNEITLQEFRIAYLEVIKKPNTFDSKNNREEFLDELIHRTVLAHEAQRQDFSKDEIFQIKVEAFYNKALRSEHFETVIRPQLSISESDIEEVYQFTQEQRRIRHLFYKDKAGADSAFSLLNNGAQFDSLARECFNDSLLARNGGELGWVQWDQLDYDIAMNAFRQPIGKYSMPVRSPYGYHIIEVMDYKKNPLITRQQYITYRRKAKALVESKLGDKYALEFVRSLISRAQIEYNQEVMAFVEKKFQDMFTRQPQKTDQMQEIQLFDEEFQKAEISFWDARNEIMATINGHKFTVKDFLGHLLYIPYEATYRGFLDAFKLCLRDFLLSVDARERNLDKSLIVRLKTKIYQNYLLQLAYRIQKVKSVEVTEQDILLYYQKYKRKNKEITLEQIRPIAQKLLLNDKKQKVIPDLLKKLMKNMIVKKNIKIIHDYYDGVKKGSIR
jgi:parvulin-like peptidyl-prolyl isomerase